MVMHGTIEPRLIALLNDTSPEYTLYSNLSLPPLQDPNILKSSGRPSPLEPDAGNRTVKHSSLSSSQNRENSASTSAAGLESLETPKKSLTSERTLGGSSPQSLRKILDDPEAAETSSSKKRNRGESNKEDFVQLPQPPKKQKAVKQPVPPIIIGLFEPPPQTAVFPPIASSSFHDSHGRNSLNTASALVPKTVPKTSRKEDVPVRLEAKPKHAPNDGQEAGIAPKQTTKSRRKWSEEETTDLLKGVQKHGIGKWTLILKDPEFHFNERKAVDIKDRWRVICPDELRGKGDKAVQDVTVKEITTVKSRPKTKSNPIFDNILVSSSSDSDLEEPSSSPAPLTAQKPRKSKAHRKKLSDLADLGISQSLAPSSRRSRRPFTEEEDQNILLGFQEYGNQWAYIVKDSKLGLQHRKPTDIRDRVRNRWPEKHAAASSTNATGKENKEIAASSSKDKRDALDKEGHDVTKTYVVPGLAGPSTHGRFTGVETGAVVSSSQDATTRPHLPALPAAAPLLFNLPSMGQSFHQAFSFPSAPSAPAQFMSFSEMLNGDDWGPNDGAGLAEDAVGEMDISRFLTDVGGSFG